MPPPGPSGVPPGMPGQPPGGPPKPWPDGKFWESVVGHGVSYLDPFTLGACPRHWGVEEALLPAWPHALCQGWPLRSSGHICLGRGRACSRGGMEAERHMSSDGQVDRWTSSGGLWGLCSRLVSCSPRTPACSPRAPGQCCCPHQHTSEADPPAAHGPPFARAPRCPTRCLARDAATDAVARAAGPARAHGSAAPEAEPHHPHPEAAGPGPCGNPAGARVQVGRGPHSLSTRLPRDTGVPSRR